MNLKQRCLAAASALVVLAASATVLAAGKVTAAADLQVTGTASTTTPAPSGAFAYRATVRNAGPSIATRSVITDKLPVGVVLSTATIAGGTCSSVTASGVTTVTCTIASLAVGVSAAATFNVVAPAKVGLLSDVVSAKSAVADPLSSNNSANIAVTVTVPAVAPPAPVQVVSYSNFGAVPPAATTSGLGVAGLQANGAFTSPGFQFTAGVSGTVSSIRLPIHEFDIGGKPDINVQIFADNTTKPNTLGALLGTYPGQSVPTKSTSTALTTVTVTAGASLVAGGRYWIVVSAPTQSRHAWALNTIGRTSIEVSVDNLQTTYTPAAVQAAFEIDVTK